MLDTTNVDGTTGTASFQSPEPLRIVEIPFRPVLTARGDAAVAVIRLKRQLARLDDVDRAYIVEMIREMVQEVGDVRP